MSTTIQVAFAGNPNVGKSTLFNKLTGVNQQVGNYPGVTVERLEGTALRGNYRIQLIDLPGIYSMNALSPEEVVTRNIIATEQIDIIVNVIDASQLERNLYLTLQLLEMRRPVILFVNMVDIAARRGKVIDADVLAREVGVPVIIGRAKDEAAVRRLTDAIIAMYKNPIPPIEVPYSSFMKKKIAEIMSILASYKKEDGEVWRAIRFLEESDVDRERYPEEVLARIDAVVEQMKQESGIAVASMIVVQERYALIKGVASRVVKAVSAKQRFSEQIDAVILHPLLAFPIFFVSLYALFTLVFSLGDPLSELFARAFLSLGNGVRAVLPSEGHFAWIASLLVDGIIGGVGGVITFLPNIFLMFLGLSFLEGSGYMSRVAVIMDNAMSKVGLSGKAFMPMILGFGCSVPAVMATRIIENKWERLATIMVIPFMSCSARLPVYILLVSAFFPASWHSGALLFIYLLGALLAAVAAKILRLSVFKGESNPLLVELPVYSFPTFSSLMMQTWHRVKHFLEKAGTTILVVSIVLWALNTFPVYTPPQEGTMPAAEVAAHQAEHSAMGRIGKVISPFFRVMGGDERIGTAFLASLAAKELFVSQLNILYSLGEDTEHSQAVLQQELRQRYTVPAALAFLLFTLLTAPCIATFAVVRSETRTWKWPIAQFFGMAIIAWIVSVLVYHIGMLFV